MYVATNGVVIVTEKKLPSVLIDGDDVSKISLITPSTGFAYSGLGPDYRVLARKSRKQAQSYYNIYREVGDNLRIVWYCCRELLVFKSSVHGTTRVLL